ncbi:UNVERIFIED_ORG: ParB/RepB/Spo0J family partition protein [Roseateles sp. XES5]|nr:ParB/RepB/Spo0J family partition protein [Roseateles sp. XES5]
MEQMLLTADRLVLDTHNARKMRNADSLDSLKASILAHGIIQPIAVRAPAGADRDLEGDRYRVFAGGRRLQAVNELIFDGKLPADYLIPALLKPAGDDDAEELSLAENIMRRAMRPVDEFKAFVRLADEGLSVEEIALRFGQSIKFVMGRLALGGLHETLLELVDDGKLSFAAASAYTLEPDPDRQLEIYDNLPTWCRDTSHNIKTAITGAALRSNGQVATFIGEERYLAAGGKVTVDLFEDHNFWISLDLIERLKVERIAELKADLTADGWSFVKTLGELACNSWQLTRLKPEEVVLSADDQARMDEMAARLGPLSERAEADQLDDEEFEEFERLEKEYEAFQNAGRKFSAEQKAKSGVVIYDDRNYQVEFGMVEPKASSSASTSSPKQEKDPLALSAPTLSELGKASTVALAHAVEANPPKALAMLAAFLELGTVSSYTQYRPGRLKFEQPGSAPGSYGSDTSPRSYADAFKSYSDMDAAEIGTALAKLVSRTVDVSQEWLGSNAAMRRATLDAFDVDPTPHFDVDSFFKAARKPIIFAAYKEITGQDLKDGKKADMVTAVVDVAKRTGWLPEYLRTAGYKGPMPTAPEPKKAKAKKK